VPPELTYFGDASGAGGSRIGDGEQEVDAGSKKWMVQKDEARQQASRTRNFHHVTNSGLRCTPKMVHTTSRGVHPKWYTPRGVVHTTSRGVHLKWFTPRGVVHNISCGAHQKWSTPQGVVHTKSCSHHQHTHRKLLANYGSADSLTIQKILLYRS